MVSHLAASQLDLVAAGLQLVQQQVAVVPLNLDNAVFDGTAAAALFLQGTGQLFEGCFRQRDTGDDDYRAAAAPFGLALQAYRTVGRRRGGLLLAPLVRFCLFGLLHHTGF